MGRARRQAGLDEIMIRSRWISFIDFMMPCDPIVDGMLPVSERVGHAPWSRYEAARDEGEGTGRWRVLLHTGGKWAV